MRTLPQLVLAPGRTACVRRDIRARGIHIIRYCNNRANLCAANALRPSSSPGSPPRERSGKNSSLSSHGYLYVRPNGERRGGSLPPAKSRSISDRAKKLLHVLARAAPSRRRKRFRPSAHAAPWRTQAPHSLGLRSFARPPTDLMN